MPTIAVDGVRLHVEVSGEGPGVLLIHGSGIDGRAWAPIAAELAADHRVVVVDRRGYGRSAGPPQRDWAIHARDAAAVLAETGTVAAVVGWSNGAVVALELAAQRPDLVSALALVEPGLRAASHPTPALVANFARAQLIRRVRGPRAGLDRYMTYLCAYGDTGESVWSQHSGPDREAVLGNAAAFWAEAGARDKALMDERLRQIRARTVVGVGERTHPWLRACADGVVAALPDAHLLVIPGANHALAATAPDATAALIREHVSAVAASGHQPT